MNRVASRALLGVLVGAAGLAAVLLALAHERSRRNADSDLASAREVSEIRFEVATAHLWIEEHLAGDSVDLREVERGLARSERLIRAISARNAKVGELAVLSDQAADDLRRFRTLTDLRRETAEMGRDVGPGSALDREYDRVFAALNRRLRSLDAFLAARQVGRERVGPWRVGSALAAWTLAVLGAAWLILGDRGRRVRTSRLDPASSELLHHQKMESVGRLAGGLAHDVNNYLAAISAQAEVVKMRSPTDSGTTRRMDAILGTVERASALIERLLAFSRRQPARPELVDVNEVVRGLESILRRLLGEDVALELEIRPNVWPVLIDAAQLEQVLMNLAVNAREAMVSGGRLTVATRNLRHQQVGHRDSSDAVELAVEDTGGGVPEDARERIFDPFFSTKGSSHSGLGLATVLGIVEQNGGRVLVEQGHSGACFRVQLPRGRGVVAARPPRADRIVSSGEERILLVEDNDEVRASTRDLLEGWGYEVVEAADAVTAEEYFQARSEAFDLVITDVVMPGRSGRELAERLTAVRSDLPVLFLSGHTEDVVLRHGLEAGAIDLLAKPFSAAELGRRVRGAIEHSARDLDS